MSSKKRDWSEKDLRKHLIDQRKFLWRRDTLDRIAAELGLSKGMSVADVGCGLGYLGWSMQPYYGHSGTYTGIDCSIRLLAEAVELSEDWAAVDQAGFVKSTAYSLPFPDGTFHLTMCQTLLMHLEFPEEALKEMVRITVPGGHVMCMEPDNVSTFTIPSGSSPGMSDSELLWILKNTMIWARGRKRLGRGDWGIGRVVPKMMSDAGLVGIDARHNDHASFLQPPYETESQRFALENLKDYLDKDEAEQEEEGRKSRDEWKECFLAGGGSISTYHRLRRFWKNRRQATMPVLRQQVEEGEFWSGMHGSHFYCVTGRKPHAK